jgi:hypothetical protein
MDCHCGCSMNESPVRDEAVYCQGVSQTSHVRGPCICEAPNFSGML